MKRRDVPLFGLAFCIPDARVSGFVLDPQVTLARVGELGLDAVGRVRFGDRQANQLASPFGPIEAVPRIVRELERFWRRVRTDVDDRAQFIGAKGDHVVGEASVSAGR